MHRFESYTLRQSFALLSIMVVLWSCNPAVEVRFLQRAPVLSQCRLAWPSHSLWERDIVSSNLTTETIQCLVNLMVECPPYKWDTVVRFHHEVPYLVSSKVEHTTDNRETEEHYLYQVPMCNFCIMQTWALNINWIDAWSSKPEVGGSNPSGPAKHVSVAQQVEQKTFNLLVGRSNRPGHTKQLGIRQMGRHRVLIPTLRVFDPLIPCQALIV